MYQMLSALIENISNFMYSYLLIIMLLAVGLYFTVRTKFVQFKFLGESIRLVSEKNSDKNSVSAFQALMVSTASRVGGNLCFRWRKENCKSYGRYGAGDGCFLYYNCTYFYGLKYRFNSGSVKKYFCFSF